MKCQLLTLTLLYFCIRHAESYRTWVCTDNKCVKTDTKQPKEAISIGECKTRCLKYGGLWPKPTGSFFMANHTSNVDLSSIKFEYDVNKYPENRLYLLNAAKETFIRRVKHADDVVDTSGVDTLYNVIIKIKILDPKVWFFKTNVDESYKIRIIPAQNNARVIEATVEGNTFLGVRHGLETLSQLFFYDDINTVHKMIDEAVIEDSPTFTHRGVVLDTARSYITVDNIKKTLDAMGANKLNTFHWHMTDSQSFPYVSKAYPVLSENGAYSKREVYTQKDIKDLVTYAEGLGIRIVPEFDAPAHVGEGWSALDPNLVTCFKWQPWRSYCVEPPCGQFDPTNEKVYEVVGNIFKEYLALFPSDLFHMGGDEVNLNCWKSTDRITNWMANHNYPINSAGFHRLWGEYQEKMFKKLRAVGPDKKPDVIVWTSTLTEPPLMKQYLPPEDYIIQVWTLKTDPTIRNLIQNKYRIILSNYDELYFDCGWYQRPVSESSFTLWDNHNIRRFVSLFFSTVIPNQPFLGTFQPNRGPSWVGQPGQNWCSPYIGWQYVYRHDPYQILQKQGIEVNDAVKKLVLGSEAAIWTEQIDNNNLLVRLWPRAAALGERLWSNPKEDWTDAQFRMNNHRERLGRTTLVEVLQPKWCHQNDGYCD